MSDFQQAINYNQPLGVVGEIAFSGPQRAAPYNLVSDPTPNVIGNAFYVTNGGDPDPSAGAPNAGQAHAGSGAGKVFAGILVSPKEYASFGGATGPLSPTITLADNKIGYLLTMGTIFASLGTTGNLVGNAVYSDDTTGALGSMSRTSAFTGVVATNTLTVSGFVAGGAPLAVGTEIAGTGVTPKTYITALGSGTGGNGTYTVGGAATVSSTAMTGNAIAPSGKTFVPNCSVARYDSSAAAAAAGSCNAVIQLTN